MAYKRLSTKGHQGYMPGSEGPFRCDHCEYYPSKGNCDNETVIGWAKEGKYGLSLQSNGNAKVDADGCSDEFKKK